MDIIYCFRKTIVCFLCTMLVKPTYAKFQFSQINSSNKHITAMSSENPNEEQKKSFFKICKNEGESDLIQLKKMEQRFVDLKDESYKQLDPEQKNKVNSLIPILKTLDAIAESAADYFVLGSSMASVTVLLASIILGTAAVMTIPMYIVFACGFIGLMVCLQEHGTRSMKLITDATRSFKDMIKTNLPKWKISTSIKKICSAKKNTPEEMASMNKKLISIFQESSMVLKQKKIDREIFFKALDLQKESKDRKSLSDSIRTQYIEYVQNQDGKNVLSNRQLATDLTSHHPASNFKDNLNIVNALRQMEKADEERATVAFLKMTNSIYDTYQAKPEDYISEIKKVSEKQTAMEIYLKATVLAKITNIIASSLEKQCQGFSSKTSNPKSVAK